MTTKRAIIATVCILIGAIVLGLAGLLLFLGPNARAANERAAMLGQGIALFALLPIGAIWIKWAARFQKERDCK